MKFLGKSTRTEKKLLSQIGSIIESPIFMIITLQKKFWKFTLSIWENIIESDIIREPLRMA